MFIQGLKPVIDQHSHVLILGSMPSEESLRKQEYYANPRNQFWRILGTLFSSELLTNTAYAQKLEFILHYKFALWDVIATCEREGSLDSHIKSPQPNPFAELLAQYPEIRYVAFNGKKAFEVFNRQVGFELKEGLVYQTLPSTSPANTVSWERKLNEWQLLRTWIR
ncbi:DNA-deoxyinosine glycosylase [Desulfitobacterium metallireducens]|uniref:DNA glycosylase n=1 Tax=Desulfitobacterium metallireducens DSM 15288 TaxID=871968 RepID=W0EE29_9FIRM|nr:DNA-deoxyinosine glycosylase [Desulfitobacterium metallireducens]AHF07459.1 DNA glycosylase [Desulfitobacterium metallireducens DSM 15288]